MTKVTVESYLEREKLSQIPYVATKAVAGTGFGAIIIPICRHRGLNKVGMIEQDRAIFNHRSLEFPRGGTDDLSEAEARRELVEETNAEPTSMQYLGMIAPDNGILTTKVGVWSATYDSMIDEFSNPNENDLHFSWKSIAEARRLLTSQAPAEAMSLAAYLIAEEHGIFYELL